MWGLGTNSRLTLPVDIYNAVAYVEVFRSSVSANLSRIALDNDGEQPVHQGFRLANHE